MKTRLVMAFAAFALVACDDKKPEATKIDAPKEAADAVADKAKSEGAATPPAKPAEDPEADAKDPKGAGQDAAEGEAFGVDAFDRSSPDADETIGHLINGLQRMSPEETTAALLEVKPVLDEIAKGNDKADTYMPPHAKASDPEAYTTRAYPVGKDAVFFLFREASKDLESNTEDEIYKATLLYDRKSKKAAYQRGTPDWKREESYHLHEVASVPMLLVTERSQGGTCAAGGTNVLYASLPGGVVKALERGWSTDDDGGPAAITVGKSGVVKVTSQPAVKKDKKKETFTTNKVEETCRFSNEKFTCVKKVVEKGVVTPGCF